MVFRWKEEHTSLFLKHYLNYPVLWNVKLPEYKDREERIRARKSLIKDLNIEGVTEEDVILKIKGIRTRYTAELKKIQRSRRSGCPEEKVYVPKLYWFKQADTFLNAVCVTRETVPNRAPKVTQPSTLLEELSTASVESLQSNSSESSGNDIKRFKSDRSSNTYSKSQEIWIDEGLDNLKRSPTEELNNLQSVADSFKSSQEGSSWSNSTRYNTNNKSSNRGDSQGLLCMVEDRLATLREDDECDIIGKNVTAKLRSLLPIQKIFAEKIINDTLYEAQLNNLSRLSHLSNPTQL